MVKLKGICGENAENDDFDREDDDEEDETDEEDEDESLKVLKMRYAKGDITREDFEQKKKDLEEK